jgi:predicted phosphodiesterase
VIDETARPLATPEEYRRVIEDLRTRLAGDPRAAELAGEIEKRLPRARQAARRTALISDIHGNHDGLLAVLADIERQGCDRIVCLGDLVEGGPGNERVVATLRGNSIPCVRGNHDEENDLALPAETRAFLRALPESMVEDDVLYIHISPRATKRKLNHAVEAWNVFEDTDYRLVFVGHVHIPYVFGRRSSTYGEASRLAFEYNRPLRLARDDRYIVSVGSVGYGRDDLGKLRYAIFDNEEHTVELRAIDGPVLPLDYSRR